MHSRVEKNTRESPKKHQKLSTNRFIIAVEIFEKIYVEFYGCGSHVVGTHLFSVTILVGGKFCNLGSTGFDHGKMIK